MAEANFEIAIMGAGCIGSSIAYNLTRRGFHNTTLVDSGRKTLSATSQSGGMLRVFHESAQHVQLALSNFDLLKRYHSYGVLKETLEPNGHLYFFNRKRYPEYENNLNMMTTANYPFEVLTPESGALMFPQFHWGDNEWAIYEPLASHRSPIEFSDDLLRAGQAGGVVLHDDFEVQRICYFRDHYRLISKDSVIKAKTLILAGGARMLPHLKDLGIAHSLDSKMITTYVALKDHEYFQLPSFFDRETLEFARLGVGKHVVLSNPHSRRLKEPFWHNDFTLVQAHDSYAPHRLGLCGFLLGQSRLMLATGWGGTAFKFSLEIGNRIGQTLETELTERNLLHA